MASRIHLPNLLELLLEDTSFSLLPTAMSYPLPITMGGLKLSVVLDFRRGRKEHEKVWANIYWLYYRSNTY
jgi:hypothetical protein